MDSRDETLARQRRLVDDIMRVSPAAQRLAEERPEVLDAWRDPGFDYAQVDFHPVGYYAPHDDAVELIENGTLAQVTQAWRRIEADVRAGVHLDTAVNRWGIRGHPDFADWWPVTPPPWGDAADVPRWREALAGSPVTE